MRMEYNVIKNIIGDIVNKYLNKNNVLDVNKIKEYQNITYRITQNDNNKCLTFNKKEYILLLNRIIEYISTDVSINKILYTNTYNDIDINDLYNDICLELKYYKYNKNIYNNEIFFSIIIPEKYNNLILNKYKEYLLSFNHNDIVNKYMNLLNKNCVVKEDIIGYKKFKYSFDLNSQIENESDENDKNDENNENENDEDEDDEDDEKYTEYLIINLLLFCINNCKLNHVFYNMALILRDHTSNINKPVIDSHRNKILFYKHDSNTIKAFQYDPHGNTNSFSKDDMNISILYKLLNDKIKYFSIIHKDLIPINFDIDISMCTDGPQYYVKSEDIGYCTIFSTFWFDIFLRILKTNVLSNIPIENWIGLIDEEIISLKNNYIVRYSNDLFDINDILSTFVYIFKEDFKLNKIFFNKKEIHNEKQYIDMITNRILTKFNKEFNKDKKININMVYDYYHCVLDEYVSDDKDILINIKSKRFKLKELEYFSIFVNYAYDLFEQIYTNKHNKVNLNNFNKFITDPNFLIYLYYTFDDKLSNI